VPSHRRGPLVRRCGEEGRARDSLTRELAHEPFGRPTTLLVTIRCYRCAGCARVWRQDLSNAAEPRAKLSRSALQWALKAIVCQHLTVTGVAEALAVSWNTANNAVLAEGQRVLIADPARFDGVRVIRQREIHRLHASAGSGASKRFRLVMSPRLGNYDVMPTLMDVWDSTRMRLLIELDRASSLSAAAAAIGISQPSASEHLRLLNSAAGEPVAERSGRSLVLTPAGQILARCASQALASLAAGESTLAARAGLRSGVLSVGASSVPGTYILPAVVASFIARCPDVAVRVSVGSTEAVMEWLHKGRITLAIICSESKLPGLRSESIGADEIVGICSPGAVDISSDGCVSLDQLKSRTLLVQEHGSSTRAQALRLHTADPGWGAVWEMGSIDAIKRVARQSTGIGFVCIYAITDERRRGELVDFTVSGVDWGQRDVRAVTLRNVVQAPADRYFQALLTEAIAKGSGT